MDRPARYERVGRRTHPQAVSPSDWGSTPLPRPSWIAATRLPVLGGRGFADRSFPLIVAAIALSAGRWITLRRRWGGRPSSAGLRDQERARSAGGRRGGSGLLAFGVRALGGGLRASWVRRPLAYPTLGSTAGA